MCSTSPSRRSTISSSSFANGVRPPSLIASIRFFNLSTERTDLLARFAPVIARDLVGLLRVLLEDSIRSVAISS